MLAGTSTWDFTLWGRQVSAVSVPDEQQARAIRMGGPSNLGIIEPSVDDQEARMARILVLDKASDGTEVQ